MNFSSMMNCFKITFHIFLLFLVTESVDESSMKILNAFKQRDQHANEIALLHEELRQVQILLEFCTRICRVHCICKKSFCMKYCLQIRIRISYSKNYATTHI